MSSAEKTWQWSFDDRSLILSEGTAAFPFDLNESGRLQTDAELRNRISALDREAAERINMWRMMQQMDSKDSIVGDGEITFNGKEWRIQSPLLTPRYATLQEIFSRLFPTRLLMDHPLRLDSLPFEADEGLDEISPKLIAHFFGDSFVHDMNMNGQLLEGISSNEIINFLLNFITHLDTKRKTPISKHLLSSINGTLTKSSEILNNFEKSRHRYIVVNNRIKGSNKDLKKRIKNKLKEIKVKFTKYLAKEISDLAINQSLMIPGGWTDSPFGHAVYYWIRRTDEDAYQLMVSNRGSGIENNNIVEVHQWEGETLQSKAKYSPFLCHSGITKEQLTRLEVWQAFYEMHVNIHEEGTMGTHYSFVDVINFLKAIVPDFASTPLPYNPENLIQYTSQSDSGVCAWKNLVPLLQLWLQNEMNWRVFKHELRLFVCVNLHSQFQNNRFAVATLMYKRIFGLTWNLHSVLCCCDLVTLTEQALSKYELSISKDCQGRMISVQNALEARQAMNALKVELQFLFNGMLIASQSPQLTITSRESCRFLFTCAPPFLDRSSSLRLINSLGLLNEETAPLDDPLKFGFEVDCIANVKLLVPALNRAAKQVDLGIKRKSFSDTYRFIHNIFSALPPPDDEEVTYWSRLSSAEAESLMTSLENLSESYLHVAIVTGEFKHCATLSQLCYSLKVLAIMDQAFSLLKELPEYAGLHFNQEVTFLPSESERLQPKSPAFVVLDPRLDLDWKRTMHYFHTQERSQGFLYVKNSDNTEEEREGITSDDCTEGDVSHSELRMTYEYLQKHPDRKRRIEDHILKEGCTKSIALTVAHAVADNDGEYLPKAFGSLKNQYYRAEAFALGSSEHNSKKTLKRIMKEEESKEKSAEEIRAEILTPGDIMLLVHIEDQEITINFEMNNVSHCDNNQRFKQFKRLLGPWESSSIQESVSELYQSTFQHSVHEGNQQNYALVSSLNTSVSVDIEKRKIWEWILCPDNKKFQVMKAILYAEENWSDLQFPDMAKLFAIFVLEPTVLHYHFESVVGADRLCARFVKTQYARFLTKHDIRSSIYFFLLGLVFDKFLANSKKGKNADTVYSINNPMPHLHRMWSLDYLTPEDRSLICVAILFTCALNKQQIEKHGNLGYVDIIFALLYLKEHLIDEKNHVFHIFLKYIAEKEMELFAKHLVKSHKKRVAPEDFNASINKHFTVIIKRIFPNAVISEWECQNFPIVRTKDATYEINLESMTLAINGLVRDYLPRSVLTLAEFREVYPKRDQLKEIRFNANCYFFKDRVGNVNKIVDLSYFEKIVNGITYCAHFTKEENGHLLSPAKLNGRLYIWGIECTAWQSLGPEPHVLFINNATAEVQGRYDSRTGSLESLREGPTLGLFLVDKSQCRNNYEIFSYFDSHYQVWCDASGQVKTIELPCYDLYFHVTTDSQGKQKISSDRFPNSYLCEDQEIGVFRTKFRNYLVLETSQNNKIVLIPDSSFEFTQNISGVLKLENLPIRGKTFFEFNCVQEQTLEGIQERLLGTESNIKANLFLGILLSTIGRHLEAQEIFSLYCTSNVVYTIEELRLIECYFKKTKSIHIHLIAEKLFVACLVISNKKTFANDKELGEMFSRDFAFICWLTENYNDYLQKSKYATTHLLTESQEKLITSYTEGDNSLTFPHRKLLMGQSIEHSMIVIKANMTEFNAIEFDEEPTPPSQSASVVDINAPIQTEDFLLTRPKLDEFEETLVHYGSIISHQPVDISLRAKIETIRVRLRLGSVEYMYHDLGHYYVGILEGMMRSPDKFHFFAEVVDLIRTDPRKALNVFKKNSQLINETLNAVEATSHYRVVVPPSNRRVIRHVSKQPIVWRCPDSLPDLLDESEIRGLFQRSKEAIASEDVRKKNVRNQLAVFEEVIKQFPEPIVCREIEVLKQEIEESLKVPILDCFDICREAIGPVVIKLKKIRTEVEIAINACREKIRFLVNKLPEDPGLEIVAKKKLKLLKLHDLFLLFLRGDVGAYQAKNPLWNLDQIHEIQRLIGEFLIYYIKKQQCDRALKCISDLQGLPPGSDESDLVQQLHVELTAKSYVDAVRHPSQLLFQYFTDMLLRKDQVDTLDKFYQSKHFIIQRDMGYGKSTLRTLIAQELADGTNLILIMVPHEFLDLTLAEMNKDSRQIFRIAHQPINWDDTSNTNLRLIKEKLNETIANGGFQIVSDKQIRLFNLNKRLAEYQLAHLQEASESSLSEAKDKVKLFREIQELMEKKGIIIRDEVDLLHDIRDEVHISFGDNQSIEKNRCEIVDIIFKVFFTSPELQRTVHFECLREQHRSSKTSELFNLSLFEKIKLDFIKYLFAAMHEKAQKEKNSVFVALINSIDTHSNPSFKIWILHYLADDEKELSKYPDLLESLNANYRNAWSDLREAVKIISHTLTEVYLDSYGFISDSVIVAKPYRKGKPKPRSQFGNQIALLAYTMQSYIKTGIKDTLVKQEIARFQMEAQRDMPSAQAKFLRLVVTPHYSLMSINPLEMLLVTRNINQTLVGIIEFVSTYVFPTLTSPQKRISSRSHELTRRSSRTLGFSGTLHEHDAYYPNNLRIEREKNLAGMFSIRLAEMSDGIVVIKSTEPTKILNELDAQGIMHQVDALIDLGGYFQNYTAEKIAVDLLNLNGLHSREGVVHSQRNRQVIPKRAGSPIPVNKMPPEKRFSFYAQTDCIAVHIDHRPTAVALVTVNINIKFRDLRQAVKRMRKFHQKQRIIFVIPTDVARVIASNLFLKPGTPINGNHVELFSKINESMQSIPDNVLSLIYKMGDAIDETIEGVINEIPVDDLCKPVYQALTALNIKIDVYDPYLQYGKFERLTDATAVLQRYKSSLLSKVNAFLKQFRDDLSVRHVQAFEGLDKRLDELIGIALSSKPSIIPKQLRANLESIDTAVESIEREETEQQAQQEREEQQQRMIERLNMEERRPLEFELLTNLEGLFVQSYYRVFDEKLLTHEQDRKYEEEETPAMKRTGMTFIPAQTCIQRQLSTEPAVCLEALNGLFPNALLVSEAYLFATDPIGKPFGFFQKPVETFLVIQNIKSSNLHVIILSAGEINQISEFLNVERMNPYKGNRDFRICLYNPDKKCLFADCYDNGIVEEGSDKIDPKVLARPAFQLLLVQIRFFSGKTNYTEEEQHLLRHWLSANKNIKEIEKFFIKHILQWKQQERDHYNNSVLAMNVFRPLIKNQNNSPQKVQENPKKNKDERSLSDRPNKVQRKT